MIPPPSLLKPVGEMNLFVLEILNIFLISWKKRDPSECHLLLSLSLSLFLAPWLLSDCPIEAIDIKFQCENSVDMIVV